MSQPICVLCAYYHPATDRHPPDRGQTCGSGRRRLENEVMALRAAYRRLLEQDDQLVGANDAASRLLPAAPVPGASKQPSVSGTREKRIPLTDVADLTAPARPGTVSDPYGDQVGQLSVATVINEWVAGWHERFFPGHRRPTPVPGIMFDWLLGVRLELVCDADPAITDFAAEIGHLRQVIAGHLGDREPKKMPMWGVACPRCDMVSQLMLNPEDPDRYRECGNCGKLMTQDEYHAHLRELVDQYRSGRNLARG